MDCLTHSCNTHHIVKFIVIIKLLYIPPLYTYSGKLINVKQISYKLLNQIQINNEMFINTFILMCDNYFTTNWNFDKITRIFWNYLKINR